MSVEEAWEWEEYWDGVEWRPLPSHLPPVCQPCMKFAREYNMEDVIQSFSFRLRHGKCEAVPQFKTEGLYGEGEWEVEVVKVVEEEEEGEEWEEEEVID